MSTKSDVFVMSVGKWKGFDDLNLVVDWRRQKNWLGWWWGWEQLLENGVFIVEQIVVVVDGRWQQYSWRWWWWWRLVSQEL